MPELFQVVTIAEANARLTQHLAPLARVETLALHEALDRVLAETCARRLTCPPFRAPPLTGSPYAPPTPTGPVRACPPT